MKNIPKYLSLIVILTAIGCSVKPKKTDSNNTEQQSMNKSTKLHDIWALVSINGEDIELTDFRKHPTLEINTTENRAMGNDGCNSFTGELKQVDENALIFGKLAGTKMACPNMELSSKINSALNQTKGYELNNLRLTLLDAEGKELLKYKKVD